MKYLRTPDERFENLEGYGFEPHYLMVDDTEGSELRIHYVDEGPRDAPPVLMLHGEPSWSYLYRKMIVPVAEGGHRVIAPDLVGFGRSDKPTDRGDHSYARHVGWMQSLIDQLDLRDITLFCQDWGGLIGLRLVAENPARFARVVAANTMLPTGDHDPGEGFRKWQQFSQTTSEFKVGKIIRTGLARPVSDSVLAAYDAPFPDDSYKAGPRQMPALVPTRPDDPASEANRRAWQVLKDWRKPFLTAFSDQDPVTGGGDRILQKLIPGCAGQPHVTIENGGHFLQEDQGEQLARLIGDFIARSS